MTLVRYVSLPKRRSLITAAGAPLSIGAKALSLDGTHPVIIAERTTF
jgi:hypothetical protein